MLNLAKKDTKRIVFNEITKTAIVKAIENPRSIDLNLVDAQQARRVLDRLVGFELSPILWKKVKPSLSAGRVQSVAVKLVVDREREIKSFTSKSDFKVSANLKTSKGELVKAEISKRLADKDEASDFLNSCKGATYQVDNVEVKPTFRKPAGSIYNQYIYSKRRAESWAIQ